MHRKLKPCPFCGGKPEFLHIFENKEKCMIECSVCDGGIDKVFLSERAAKAAWNGRVILGRKAKRLIKWAAISILSVILFLIGKESALRERGYSAIGGEYLLLLLPVFYYIFERVIKDWIEAIRELIEK